MKLFTKITLLTLLVFSITCFADNAHLMHESHEKLKEAQQEMEIIKNTKDPEKRNKLLDEHMKTMQEFNDLVLQIEVDPKRGGEGQGTAMTDLMHERVRYLEQMMQQILENQSERMKLEN